MECPGFAAPTHAKGTATDEADFDSFDVDSIQDCAVTHVNQIKKMSLKALFKVASGNDWHMRGHAVLLINERLCETKSIRPQAPQNGFKALTDNLLFHSDALVREASMNAMYNATYRPGVFIGENRGIGPFGLVGPAPNQKENLALVSRSPWLTKFIRVASQSWMLPQIYMSLPTPQMVDTLAGALRECKDACAAHVQANPFFETNHQHIQKRVERFLKENPENVNALLVNAYVYAC